MNRWILVLLVAGVACSSTGPYRPTHPCQVDHINCGDNPSVQCDDRDELCKCGPFENGLVCAPGSVCAPQGGGAFTCVSTLCTLASCERGESCNPTTGACACGEGESARACSDDQRCENGQCTPDICAAVECRFGQACDPTDGTCKCGGTGGATCSPGDGCVNGTCTQVPLCKPPFAPDCQDLGVCDPTDGSCKCGGGPTCPDGQYCKDGVVCAPDTCYGVNCPELTRCSRDDSSCHCIGSDPSRPPLGPICSAGQSCSDDGKCLEVDLCKNVSCPAGTVCDPTPDPAVGGVCRCGGIGLDHPRCGQDQSCDPVKGVCQGGEQCRGVRCDSLPGTSCDPEDGFCKCGGLGGILCHTGEVCLGLACWPGCDPLAPTCDGDSACYFEPDRRLSVCLPQGSATVGSACQKPEDCAKGTTCSARTCVQYCDLSKSGADCPAPALCLTLDPARGSLVGQCARP